MADALARLTIEEIGQLLQNAGTAGFPGGVKTCGEIFVGGELFIFEGRPELDRLISAALDERHRRGRQGTTAA